MTTRRLIASLTLSTAALAVAATLAVRAFPLEAQGRAPAGTGEPIQVLRGGEHLLHGQLPEYPRRAIERKTEGDVVVDLTLNERGEVLDARVLSGPDELRKATLESLLQWHYAPSVLSSTTTQATLRFQIPPGGFEKVDDVLEAKGEEIEFRGDVKLHAEGMKIVDKARFRHGDVTVEADEAELHAKAVEGRKIMAKFEPVYDVVIEGGTHLRETLKGEPKLAEVRTERITGATAKEVLAQAGVAVGDPITEDAARRLQKAAADLDEHIVVEFQKEKKGLVITLLTR